jgi:hypothetical protein
MQPNTDVSTVRVIVDGDGTQRPRWDPMSAVAIAADPAGVARLFDVALRAAHPQSAFVEYNPVRECIELGVADDDAALAIEVPATIRDIPVRLRRVTFPAHLNVVPKRSTSARWDTLTLAQANATNAAIAEHGLELCRRHPTIVALTGGFQSALGAINYNHICVVVFVDDPTACDAAFVDERCGQFAVCVDAVPRAPAVGRATEEPTSLKWPKAQYEFTMVDKEKPFRVGELIAGYPDSHENSNELRDFCGTLGGFALENKTGRVVAFTAGHCIDGKPDVVPAEYRVQRSDHTALLAPRADARCIVHNFQTADAKLTRVSMIDHGILFLDKTQNIDPVTVGSDGHWFCLGVPRVNLTGMPSSRFTLQRAATVADAVQENLVDDKNGQNAIALHASFLVYKFGRTTFLTPGIVPAAFLFFNNGTHLIQRMKVVNYEQWVAFAKGGDSGAAVFDEDGDTVGVLTQAWDDYKFAVVTPIQDVLDEFGLTLFPSRSLTALESATQQMEAELVNIRARLGALRESIYRIAIEI